MFVQLYFPNLSEIIINTFLQLICISGIKLFLFYVLLLDNLDFKFVQKFFHLSLTSITTYIRTLVFRFPGLNIIFNR